MTTIDRRRKKGTKRALVQILVTDETARELEKRAESAGFSVSSYVRAVVLRHLRENRLDVLASGE